MTQSYFDRKDPYSLVLDVAPPLAESWLMECNPHNRKLVEAHVNRLAREMKAGRWQLTHQGIAFSPHRVLLDGQHRLWAVVLSETTVPMYVFFNQSTESLRAIDAIRPRTNDEIITLAGGLGAITKAELSTLRALLTGYGRYNRMSAGEEAQFLAQHRQSIQFAHEILSVPRFRGVVNSGTRSVLARAFYSAEHSRLRHFADVLQSGVATGEEDQPITLLFKFLIDSSLSRRGRPEVRERYGKTQRALAAFLAGEQLGRLHSATTELFPLPTEVQCHSAA